MVLSPALRHALLLPALLAACASDSQPAPVDQGAADVATFDRSLVDRATEASLADASHPDASNGPCPSLMALAGGVCVDRYEAALEERLPDGTWVAASPYLTVGTRTVRAVAANGLVPQGYISGTEAAQACAAAGKRLCTSTEWLAACQGPSGSTWPYDATYVPGACNDAYPGHPVVDFFGTSEGVWDSQHMNDPGINQQPGTVAKGGAFSGCVTADGLYDLHGNLHEWVADASGIFRGGFYADGSKNGPGCLYKTTAHAPDYHDYSTGFRCCADPTP